MQKKIVIVDDDKEFLEELQEALSFGPYDVTAVNDSMLAVEVIMEVNPAIILLDLKMPQKNGFQVAREIRSKEAYKDIPIIILSGMNDDTSRYAATKIGALEFLAKPIDIDRLEFHIEDILNKRVSR